MVLIYICIFILIFCLFEKKKGQTLIKCFEGGSFYVFLRSSFLSFGFPDVSTFITLLPPNRKSEVIISEQSRWNPISCFWDVELPFCLQLLNSFNTSELSQFLSEPGAIKNGSNICIIFSIYNNTASFLETVRLPSHLACGACVCEPGVIAWRCSLQEDVPDDVKRSIFPCLWELALSSNNVSEVNFWFDLRLRDYFQFLNKDLISSVVVQNASCLAFEKLWVCLLVCYEVESHKTRPRLQSCHLPQGVFHGK